MTAKLLPRLVATGALAAGLTAISAVSGLATSAHAAPVVSKGSNGSVNVTLSIVDIHQAAGSQATATAMCSSYIVPSADGVVAQGTCATAVYNTATSYLMSGARAYINFRTDGTYTSGAVR
jgi:hypothetical protein